MIRLLWTASVNIRRFLRRYMPSNILLDRIRTRRGLRWGILTMLLALPYLAIAYWASVVVDSGGPGWFNLLVILGIWNALKMLGIGPMSLVVLLDIRRRERRESRAHNRVSPTEQDESDEQSSLDNPSAVTRAFRR